MTLEQAQELQAKFYAEYSEAVGRGIPRPYYADSEFYFGVFYKRCLKYQRRNKQKDL